MGMSLGLLMSQQGEGGGQEDDLEKVLGKGYVEE